VSASPHLAAHSSTQKKALFIDADPEVHAMLANILDPLVWSVRHAPDNKAALTLASAAHLILTSEKTSGKEDVDLLRKIRSIRPHKRLIILTEEGTPADVTTVIAISEAPEATATSGIWDFTASISPREISSLNVRREELFECVRPA
jgi:CheY-like chemotaxis protein